MKALVVVAFVMLAAVAVLLLRDGPRERISTAPETPSEPQAREPDPVVPAPAGSPASAEQADANAAYLRRARAADIRGALNDPDLRDEVTDALLDKGMPVTVRTLERQAQHGNADANVALVRLERFCASRRAPDESGEPRDRQVLQFLPRVDANPTSFLATLRRSCREASFDWPAIERRLRASSSDGHAASLFVLGEESEEKSRRKLWTSAAMLGDVRAQMELASLLGEQKNADGHISDAAAFWWAVAATKSMRARTATAICRAGGCDSKPGDEAAALGQMREAARQGDEYAISLLSNPSPSFPVELPQEERYAWLQFNRTLWRLGCYGGESSAATLLELDEAIGEADKGLSPYVLANGRKLAESYWQQFGAGARRAQRCH